jgi:hypothetical protein
MGPIDMPPLALMVLDGLADDIESVGSLRDHGEVPPYGLALVDEQEVVDALRSLLSDGLIEAWHISEPKLQLVPCPAPLIDDGSLRRYWFRWTPTGEQVWREGHGVLEAYWDAHPPPG